MWCFPEEKRTAERNRRGIPTDQNICAHTRIKGKKCAVQEPWVYVGIYVTNLMYRSPYLVL